ncbi:sporulation histidine kinase inhibitor Sda [Paenibacillus sambharensis]|nr:sporulation histidine kinase inhibitor Sda [Paenibacillus sambharensis]
MRFSNPFLTMRNYIKEYEPLGKSGSATRPVVFNQGHGPTDSTGIQSQDKSLLLLPLNDDHLLEVYHEAKAMNLSVEFIELIEDALRMRNIEMDVPQAHS